MLYHKIFTAQVSDSKAIMALLLPKANASDHDWYSHVVLLFLKCLMLTYDFLSDLRIKTIHHSPTKLYSATSRAE